MRRSGKAKGERFSAAVEHVLGENKRFVDMSLLHASVACGYCGPFVISGSFKTDGEEPSEYDRTSAKAATQVRALMT